MIFNVNKNIREINVESSFLKHQTIWHNCKDVTDEKEAQFQ